jgi:hypothetical protein
MNGDLFDRLESDLRVAALHAAGRQRVRVRARRFTTRMRGPLALAGALFAAGGAALAATGNLPWGPPVDVPGVRPESQSADEGAPRPGERGRLLAIRTADPAGGAPWGLRVYTSTRDYPCAQFGRVVDGRLAAIDRDGRPRELALRCTADTKGYGLMSIDASAGYGPVRDRRTIIYGHVDRRARRVVVQVPRGRRSEVPVDEGMFLTVFAGGVRKMPRIYVELDDGTTVRLDRAEPIPEPGSAPELELTTPRAGQPDR